MSALRDALRDLPDAVFADLLESDDAYLLVIDVPGVTAETVDVTVEDRLLRIEARREKGVPPEYQYLREGRSLFLDAEIPLPPDATRDGAEASLEAGVLECTLPKRSTDEPTKIEIGDGSDDGSPTAGSGDDGNGDDNDDDGDDGRRDDA